MAVRYGQWGQQQPSQANYNDQIMARALDRIFQGLLQYADTTEQRGIAKQQRAEDVAFRNEQLALQQQQQAAAEQAQQFNAGLQARRAVAADPSIAPTFAGNPMLGALGQPQLEQPVMWQRNPKVMGKAPLLAGTAMESEIPTVPAEGPPAPIAGSSEIERYGQQVATRRAAQEAEQSRIGIASGGRKIKDEETLQATFGDIDAALLAGKIGEDEANELKEGYWAAFQRRQAAEEEVAKLDRKLRQQAIWASSSVTPQRFGEKEMLAAAKAGDIAAFNRYRDSQGVPKLNLKNPADAAVWDQWQERGKRELAADTDKPSAQGQSAKFEADSQMAWSLRNDREAAIKWGQENGYTPDQVAQLIQYQERQPKGGKPTAVEKATEEAYKVQLRTISSLKTQQAKEKRSSAKAAIAQQIAQEEGKLQSMLSGLGQTQRDEVLKSPDVSPATKKAIRSSGKGETKTEMPAVGASAAETKQHISLDDLYRYSPNDLSLVSMNPRFDEQTRRWAAGILGDFRRQQQAQAQPQGRLEGY